LVIERRSAEGLAERLPALAEELVRLNVELIVTNPNSATLAAKRATQTIPIVMFAAFLPVEDGLVERLARPGGNVTGVAPWVGVETSDKMFQLLKEAVPSAKRATLLIDPKFQGMHLYEKVIAQQDRNLAKIGMTVTRIGMTRPDELAAALERVVASKPDVLYVSATVAQSDAEIAAFAIQRKLVSLGDRANYLRAGGLIYYGVDPVSHVDEVASYVDRILRGAKPRDLPVQHAPKWELLLNGKSARAIGFSPPPLFMARVSQVID